MIVKYSFYVDTYGGANISEADWKRLSLKAVQHLRQVTYDRLPDDWSNESYANQVNCAVCEMSELIQADERSGAERHPRTRMAIPCHTIQGKHFPVCSTMWREYISGIPVFCMRGWINADQY